MSKDKSELITLIKEDNLKYKLKDLLELLIEDERNALETAAQNEIAFIQGSIKAYRKLLRLLA